MKTAFITGITGQDGSYLAELLLGKGYTVIGMVSAKNDIGNHNIESIKDKLILEEGDLLDKESIASILKKHQPNEIYNLGGITFVPLSWKNPALTYDVNAIGLLRILEAVREFCPEAKIFQATSAKVFGDGEDIHELQRQDVASLQKIIVTESSPYSPKDPYSISKLAAHFSVQLFRDHFNLFVCSGILFNHESERRGPEFVTRKITQGAVKIKKGLEKKLSLGNLDVHVDWGYAPDFVEAIRLMLQQDKPDDYILATGELHTVREVCEIAFTKVGLNYQDYVDFNEEFYRPEPQVILVGSPQKAEEKLKWRRSVSFKEMIEKMVEWDIENIK